ncbi:peptidase C14 caspase catalytic subunit p20 [Streptomyces sp. NPDC058326]|uniref:peptidase C14 caspase catalytic subunit p20 n=1 Tax=Streptomyces sp. NPDC058326 TaxID=3346447 RepID=UPI0036EA7048
MVEHLAMIRSERASSALVGTVAVARHAHPPGVRGLLPDLRNVADVRARFADVTRAKLGFGDHVRIDGEGATRRALWEGLDSFLAHDAERKILYWTGHGLDRGREGYYLACEDSCADGPFDPARAVALTDLVDRLLRADTDTDTLLVVDACFSHGHLPAALDRAFAVQRESVDRARRHRRTGFVVVGTSGLDATVPDGRWVEWLEQVLGTPEFTAADHARPFDPAALYLPVPYLLEAVDAAAEYSGIDEAAQRPHHVEVRALPNNFLANPYFVDPRRAIHTPAVLRDRTPWFGTEEFGLEDDGHVRRHFAGRTGALGRIVRWMDTHPRGLLAVTGPAGTGKTALLGRLALTSLPEWRDALGPGLPPATLPRTGTIHAALSCRGRSLHSLTAALWQVLARLDGMEPPPEGTATPEECRDAVDRLVGRAGSLNLLFDALDEAMPEQAHEIARHLLNPLSALWGVRLVVGTRPQPRRRTTVRVLEETLLDTLDQSAAPLVLGDDEEAGRSIETMVHSLLSAPGSPYAQQRDAPGSEDAAPEDASDTDASDPAPEDDRRWTARLVAAHSRGSFLVARLTARELARRRRPVTENELGDWMAQGGMGLDERLAEEIAHLTSQPGAERAEEILRPLAVCQEPGLSRRGPWLALANALRDGGTPELTTGDLHRVALTSAGGIVTAQHAPEGQDTSHHLAHPSYGAHFLRRAGLDAPEAHRKVVTALRARAADGWQHADAYTRHYLGAHAAQAGPEELRALFDDMEFLLRTDPDVMLPLASGLARESEGAAVYGRVGAAFRALPEDGDQRARRALLRAAAFVSHRDTAYAALARDPGFLPWQEYWTDQPPDPFEWRRPAPLGGARALSWHGGPGAAELLTGATLTAAGRGEVLVLDAESGKRLLTRRTRTSDRTRGETLTEVRDVGTGPDRTTVARDDQALYFWRSGARLPESVYRWGGTVRTLAAAERRGETVVLAADGERVWAWRWRRGAARDRGGSLVDIRMSDTERLAALTLGPRLFLLAAGRKATLHEIDRGMRATGRLLGTGVELGELTAPAYAAAAAAAPPGPDGRSQGWLAVADGSRVTVWLCETDGTAPSAPPRVHEVLGFDSAARGLAFGRHGDDTLLAVHEAFVVRVRDILDRSREARFAVSDPRDEAMAFDPGGQGVLAVADGPDLRMLHVGSALASRHGVPQRAHDQRPVVALADTPGGPPLLCRVWGERILVSRPAPGAPAAERAETLTHLAPVSAVRAARCGDAWIVAAAARRTVRLWELADDLTVRATHDLRLGGDAGERVPSLGLVVDEATGRVRVYAPDRQWIVHAELPLDAARDWRRGEPLPAGLRSHAVDARTMRDGTSWLAADLGDELLLWEHRDGRFDQALRVVLPGRGEDRAGEGRDARPARPEEWDLLPDRAEDHQGTRLALGEWYDTDDEESVPLLAWVDAGAVHVTEGLPRGKRHRLTGPVRGVTSLVFAGPPERPLLLVCDERRAPGLWDVRSKAWLDGEAAVPPRGYAVRAADAAVDPRGLVVALQGDHRCDLIRLPHAFFDRGAEGALGHTLDPRDG